MTSHIHFINHFLLPNYQVLFKIKCFTIEHLENLCLCFVGKDPYLRETLLRVTQLYCATRYGDESSIAGVTKFHSKFPQNKNVSGEISKRIRTSFNPATVTAGLSDKTSHNDLKPESLVKKSWDKESSTAVTNNTNKFKQSIMGQENMNDQPIKNYSKCSPKTMNKQIISKRHENEVATHGDSNLKFLNNAQLSGNTTSNKNVDITKWTEISHPLNLSTSSASSDESHLVFEDPSFQTKQNCPNLFSTFPFVRSTSLSILGHHNEPIISSTTSSQINSF
ncbi:unnamed protein product [Schistosoma turkestanicum]|nr:unnamed protein product [Schistosoma turkestanicum]